MAPGGQEMLAAETMPRWATWPENCGARRRHHELLQRGMDAVGADHDVGRGAGAVGECDDGLLLVLLEADASVAGVDDGRREPIHEERKQIGAVEAVELDSAGELGRPHGSGEGAVRS